MPPSWFPSTSGGFRLRKLLCVRSSSARFGLLLASRSSGNRVLLECVRTRKSMSAGSTPSARCPGSPRSPNEKDAGTARRSGIAADAGSR